MTTLLQINASIQGENGQSSQLANRFVAAWQARHPHGRVVRRDLAADPVPHLTAARFAAFLAQPEQRTAEQHSIAQYSDALIEELRAIGAQHHRSPGEVAIAWTLRLPAVTGAIVGSRSASQIEGVIGTATFRLSNGEIARIEDALAAVTGG